MSLIGGDLDIIPCSIPHMAANIFVLVLSFLISFICMVYAPSPITMTTYITPLAGIVPGLTTVNFTAIMSNGTTVQPTGTVSVTNLYSGIIVCSNSTWPGFDKIESVAECLTTLIAGGNSSITFRVSYSGDMNYESNFFEKPLTFTKQNSQHTVTPSQFTGVIAKETSVTFTSHVQAVPISTSSLPTGTGSIMDLATGGTICVYTLSEYNSTTSIGTCTSTLDSGGGTERNYRSNYDGDSIYSGGPSLNFNIEFATSTTSQPSPTSVTTLPTAESTTVVW